MEPQHLSFRAFLDTAFTNGSFPTDDVIAFVLPLFRQVLELHEAGCVAPFDRPDALHLQDHHLALEENTALQPRHAITEMERTWNNLPTLPAEEHPVYLQGYNCYEHLLGHHDAQTDIFCLGLVLASLSLGLNLYREADLQTFLSARNQPVYHNPRIHPTLSTLVTEMTELHRRDRSADLYDIIHRLEHYRDFDPEKRTDLSQVAGWVHQNKDDRNSLILGKLRNRLFDNSRRNRLLYYKPNLRFVNLTVSSLPLVLHYQSIQPHLLFTWNEAISAAVKGRKELVLNKYLRFEDYDYLPASLDKIRLESRRDLQEFGFSQLKLVVAFLNWHNLKEDVEERMQSPLLLVPVELKKVKRVHEDHYLLRILDSEAEVNPVLANRLRELYGIQLPDGIDLEEMDLPEFHQQLQQQVDAAGKGIALHYMDQPRIRIIQNVAEQSLESYRNRQRRKEATATNQATPAPAHHTPPPPPSTPMPPPPVFELSPSENNPYRWEVDTCNMVLGNFNYRKMSLVRDYNQLIDTKTEHTVFESLFSTQPRSLEQFPVNAGDPAEWNHVVTADPTQSQAVLRNRTGNSYIIQGPPGTGKSQTITNLVADFLARGKSVLFVCEKRAALDVVYHRLKQNGLDECCSYIHDSQADKKEFIRNLKATYEDFSRNRIDLKSLDSRREILLQKLRQQLETLQAFHQASKTIPGEVGTTVRQLIDRVIELKPHLTALTPADAEKVPAYGHWKEFGAAITQLGNALEEAGLQGSFAEQPVSRLRESVFTAAQPLTLLESLLFRAQQLLQEIHTVTTQCRISAGHQEYLYQVRNLVQDAVLLEPLAQHDNLDLVDPETPAARDFEARLEALRQLRKQQEEAARRNENWQRKFSPTDTQTALAIAEKQEGRFFSFLSGSWRRLKKQLAASYDFSAHQLPPSYGSILRNLQQEYELLQQLEDSRTSLQQAYHLHNFETTALAIDVLRNKKGDRQMEYLLQHPDAGELVKRLYLLNNSLHQLEVVLQQCIYDHEAVPLQAIADQLDTLALNTPILQDLLPALKQFAALPQSIREFLRQLPLSPAQAEAAMAHNSLQQFYQHHRQFASTDVGTIEQVILQVHESYNRLLQLNADRIRASVRKKFLVHLEQSNTAPGQLDAAQKEFRKNYNEGRRVLENEFSKTMRFKSIRELAAKESGLVLRDLKPVWLMSPLSVSDSLPLDTGFFDVVIFDEASQITLEEGIPSLFRSAQTIIVGDDKQMPPTNFFSARSEDPDDLAASESEDADELLGADADSLLVQGTRKLQGTMLSWHYRSRFETLISYSNHAFYEAALLTIPDRTIHHKDKVQIEANAAEDAIPFADFLFDRSISFHFQNRGVYEKRSNRQEADYIAQLVRVLLKRKVKESIGIVAFSQEQQSAIEEALNSLAGGDSEFESLLEEAFNRTEDDQFVGLIIKNLENIQGDERDIIIMSICYGYDPQKKMRMNFGPINKKGGEKRLNVIFSRAKKHMAVISSIRHSAITNEYNAGANYFRRFLQYAENVSSGNMKTARLILDGLVPERDLSAGSKSSTVVSSQLRRALEQRGYEVAEQVGQSGFKCSLAVRAPGNGEEYTLGILLDDEQHYANENLVEQYYQRPAILQAFGWKWIQLLAKDWLRDPDRELNRVLKALRSAEAVNDADAGAATHVPDSAFGGESAVPVEPAPAAAPLPAASAATPSGAAAGPTVGLPGFEDISFERYRLRQEGGDTFWEVGLRDHKLVLRYGREGSRGQVLVKTFPTLERALAEKEKMIMDKTGKGYLPAG